MNYAEVLKIALSNGHTVLCEDETRLVRTLPAIQTLGAKTSGTVIDGQFEMFRSKSGQMVFVGENGQFIRM